MNGCLLQLEIFTYTTFSIYKMESRQSKKDSRTESTPASKKESTCQMIVDMVDDKLSLSKWLHFVEEEEHDMLLVEIVEDVMKIILDKCAQRSIQKRLYSYTIEKILQRIIDLFQYISLTQRPGPTPNWKRVKHVHIEETDEPPMLFPDSLCVGFNVLHYSSTWSTTPSTQSSLTATKSVDEFSNCNFEYSSLSPETLKMIQSNLGGRRRLKSTSSMTGMEIPVPMTSKLRRDSVWPKTPEKVPLVPTLATSIEEERKLSMTSVLPPPAEEQPAKPPELPQVKKTTKKSVVRRETSKVKITKLETQPSRLSVQTLRRKYSPPAVSRKPSFRKQIPSTSSGLGKEFERIDLNHLPVNRIKTSYTIKDADVGREGIVTGGKRSPFPSKKSSIIIVTETKETEDKSKPFVTHKTIMTMPPLMDNIRSLTEGVTINQEGRRRSSAPMPPLPGDEEEEIRLKTLQAKREPPKFEISQLLDPARPPTVYRPLKL